MNNFKLNDVVVVANNYNDPSLSYYDDMNDWVGRLGTITDIHYDEDNKPYYEVSHRYWWFPDELIKIRGKVWINED